MDLQEKQIYSGVINYWNDEKGFGFIQFDQQHESIFFHISAFSYLYLRPELNQRVVFLVKKKENKWSAYRILLAEHASQIWNKNAYDYADQQPFLIESVIYIFLNIIYFSILSRVSIPLCVSGIILSAMTFYLYWRDKQQALKRKFRIPEAILYITGILGGWPGALIARQLLRHKINDTHFIVFFWASMMIHFSILYLFIIYYLKL